MSLSRRVGRLRDGKNPPKGERREADGAKARGIAVKRIFTIWRRWDDSGADFFIRFEDDGLRSAAEGWSL